VKQGLKLKTGKGFTLVEALVSIAIVSILSTISVQAFISSKSSTFLRESTDDFAQNIRNYVSMVKNGVSGSECLASSNITDKTLCRSYIIYSKYSVSSTALNPDENSYAFYSQPDGSGFLDAKTYKLGNGVKFNSDASSRQITYEFPLIKFPALEKYELIFDNKKSCVYVTENGTVDKCISECASCNP